MKKLIAIALMLALGGAITVMSLATAQPPDRKTAKDSDKAKDRDWSTHPIVKRMMAFDKNKDGKLTKDEVTDTRLHRLFDRADKNKDGVVTKDELIALAREMDSAAGDEGGRGGFGGRGKGKRGKGGPPDDDDGPPGGPGGRGRGPGGFGGRGPGGPPRPGQILPSFLQDELELTAEQKKQIDALQKEVDVKLDKILTDVQRKQLKEMRERGPGGRGPGGRGGRGPGGPPPE